MKAAPPSPPARVIASLNSALESSCEIRMNDGLRRPIDPQLTKATEDTDRHRAGRGRRDHNVQFATAPHAINDCPAAKRTQTQTRPMPKRAIPRWRGTGRSKRPTGPRRRTSNATFGLPASSRTAAWCSISLATSIACVDQLPLSRRLHKVHWHASAMTPSTRKRSEGEGYGH
jgi:hypothetical protein